MKLLAEKWKAGTADIKTLFGARNGDLSDLADYLIEQSRVVCGKKRYSPSRNLRKPREMPIRRAQNPEAELRVPPGCTLIHRAESTPGRPQRIRYYRPQETDKELIRGRGTSENNRRIMDDMKGVKIKE